MYICGYIYIYKHKLHLCDEFCVNLTTLRAEAPKHCMDPPSRARLAAPAGSQGTPRWALARRLDMASKRRGRRDVSHDGL